MNFRCERQANIHELNAIGLTSIKPAVAPLDDHVLFAATTQTSLRILEGNMFNSPLHFCPQCKQHVALDQSAAECAHEHECHADCPYIHLFRPPTTRNADAEPEQNKVK